MLATLWTNRLLVAALCAFNILDTLLTVYGIHEGMLRELNPVVLTLGFPLKTFLVCLVVIGLGSTTYARFLKVPIVVYACVIMYTLVGISIYG